MFAITDIRELWIYFERMFGTVSAGVRINPSDFSDAVRNYWPLLAVGFLFCTSIPGKLYSLIKNRFLEALLLLLVFWLSIYYLYVEGVNPFMYFRF